MDNPLSSRVSLDTSDFKDGIKAMDRELKLIETGFRATASTMGDWANSADGLKARMEALTKEIEIQQQKCETLRIRAEQLAKAHGENSIEAKNAEIAFNREAEKLGRLQVELGDTQRGLSGLKSESGKMTGAFKDLGKQFDNLKTQVPAVGTAINLLTNPISLAIGGLAAFVAISKKSISELVTYNKTIRETMQLTGLSAEETSRLVQVSDDWGIEIGDATAAMEMMNKKGITPSIDNLAKIADEYFNAGDKTAFIENATNKYGKSIANLIPILAKGGDALRNQAAAVDDNMIATEDSMKASRDYEEAMDQLNDTVQGLKYQLAEGLLPALNDVVGAFNDLIQVTSDVFDAQKIYNQLVESGVISEEKALELAKKMYAARYENTAVTKIMNEAINEYFDSVTMGYPEEERFVALHDSLTKGTINLTDETNILTQSLDTLKLALSDPLAKEMENFTGLQEALRAKMNEVEGQIATLNSQELLTEDQQKEIDDLQTEYETLKTQYAENADAHQEATRRIIIDIGMQAIASSNLSDGMKAKLYNQLLNIATQWGLTDTAALTATANITSYLAGTEPTLIGFGSTVYGVGVEFGVWGQHIETAKLKASELALKIDQLAGDYKVNIDIDVRGDPLPTLPPHVPYIPLARGYEGFVKKPTIFLAGEAGPEYVKVMPLGGNQIINRSKLANSAETIQQLVTNVINRLNIQAGPTPSGGGPGGSVYSPTWQYNIQAANSLQTSDDLVRQVRLLELMH